MKLGRYCPTTRSNSALASHESAAKCFNCINVNNHRVSAIRCLNLYLMYNVLVVVIAIYILLLHQCNGRVANAGNDHTLIILKQ